MIRKFANAGRGLVQAFRHVSVAVQAGLAGAAVIAGFVLHLNRAEWQTVILCIGMVLCCELLNTCIEKLCDLYSTTMDERIRTIKDIAAGAVLLSALTALVIAGLIFVGHIG